MNTEYVTRKGKLVLFCFIGLLIIARAAACMWFFLSKFAGRPEGALMAETAFSLEGIHSTHHDRTPAEWDEAVKNGEVSFPDQVILNNLATNSPAFKDTFNYTFQLIAFLFAIVAIISGPAVLGMSMLRKDFLNGPKSKTRAIQFTIFHMIVWISIGFFDNLTMYFYTKTTSNVYNIPSVVVRLIIALGYGFFSFSMYSMLTNLRPYLLVGLPMAGSPPQQQGVYVVPAASSVNAYAPATSPAYIVPSKV